MTNGRWRSDEPHREGGRLRDERTAQNSGPRQERSWGRDWATDYQREREHEFGPDHRRLGPGGHYGSAYGRNQGVIGAEPRGLEPRGRDGRGPEDHGAPGFEPPYRHEAFGPGGVGRGYEGYGRAYGAAEAGRPDGGYGRDGRNRSYGGWPRNVGWDDRPEDVRRDQHRRDFEQRMRRYEGRAQAEPAGPHGRRGPEDRSWRNRTRDEVGAWFGDDDAERRRRSDAEREGHYRDERSGDTGWGDPFPGDPRGGGRERRARSDRDYWRDAERQRWDRDRSW